MTTRSASDDESPAIQAKSYDDNSAIQDHINSALNIARLGDAECAPPITAASPFSRNPPKAGKFGADRMERKQWADLDTSGDGLCWSETA